MAVVMVPGTAEVAQHRELLIVEGATERSAATFDHVRDALVSSDADLTSLALHCSGAMRSSHPTRTSRHSRCTAPGRRARALLRFIKAT